MGLQLLILAPSCDTGRVTRHLCWTSTPAVPAQMGGNLLLPLLYAACQLDLFQAGFNDMVHKLAVAAGDIVIPGLHLNSEAGQMFASSSPT